jgi:glycerophosphoryl diester phosphodiesterase
MPRGPTLVIAHRGASWEERENTLAAFERAIALGADYVELDVQAARGGELVVFHDHDLGRLTPLGGPLARRSLAELAEVGIPTLAEVLELTAGRIGRMVELKSPWRYRRHDVVARTVAALTADDVLVSFERSALELARRLRPALRVLQHVGFGVSIAASSRYAWGVGFNDRLLTERGLARARRLGLATTVYTVNDPRRMRELVAAGVSGIFSDRPDLLRGVVAAATARGGRSPRTTRT